MATNKSEVDASLLDALQLSNLQQNQSSPKTNIVKGTIHEFNSFVESNYCVNSVIFDCTQEELAANYHPVWLDKNINVITANNLGLSGSEKLRKAICSKIRSSKYLPEITVGGALPIIRTLRDLLHSGDKIRLIKGILSVSLSYIFHRIAPPPGLGQSFEFDKKISDGAIEGSLYLSSKLQSKQSFVGCSFSTAVQEAIDLRLMEEDPLKDLSNEYTAQVLMVLAKELGISDDYDVKKIQQKSDILIKKCNVDKFDDNTNEIDAYMHKRVLNAAKSGCVPRHVSSINVATGEIKIEIIDVPCNHLFAITPPSCECVCFYTKTHNRYPLVIQGPSAGSDSTAKGLLAELLNLMRTKVGVRTGVLSRTSSSAFLC